MKVFADSSLPLLKELFCSPHFELILFDKHTKALTQAVDIILCRAHTKIDARFLNSYSPKVVVTASSGSDHIDKNYLAQSSIKWFDAKGCNAKSVSEYILHILFHPKFPNHKKKIGIIGVGHVGKEVQNSCHALGYETVCYDPPRAIRDPSFSSNKLESLFECDVITIHVPLITTGAHPTLNLINENFIHNCYENSVIINTSRGEVLDESCLEKFPNRYFCLDVFQNEPAPSAQTIAKCLIATPHIAGHAIEAKQRAVVMSYNHICQVFNLRSKDSNYQALLSPLPQQNQIKPTQLTYDPYDETSILKQNPTAEQFLQLRAAHKYRHEFGYL